MHVPGHIGAALLAYAPVAGLLTSVGHPELAVGGTATAVGFSTLSDVDQQLPVDHRGPTHTIWFAFLCGLAAGIVGTVFDPLLGVVTATAAVLSICSHIVGDVVTPMGVQPFAPLSDWHYSFGLVPSRSRQANAAVLLSGVSLTVSLQAVLLV